MPLRQGVRTALTLGVLAIVVLLALVWGAGKLTTPLPSLHPPAAATCVDRTVKAGATVSSRQVVVSVYNAGNRQGAANSTLTALQDRGFSAGQVGNAPGTVRVRGTQVWAAQPTGPAARLVAAQFGAGTPVRRPEIAAYADKGIVVMVGNRSALVRAPATIRSSAAATVCGPVTT